MKAAGSSLWTSRFNYFSGTIRHALSSLDFQLSKRDDRSQNAMLPDSYQESLESGLIIAGPGYVQVYSARRSTPLLHFYFKERFLFFHFDHGKIALYICPLRVPS